MLLLGIELLYIHIFNKKKNYVNMCLRIRFLVILNLTLRLLKFNNVGHICYYFLIYDKKKGTKWNLLPK